MVTALWLVLAAHGCSGQLNEAQVHYCGGPCPEGGASASLEMSLRGSGAHRELIYRLAIACPTAHPSRGSSASSAAVKGSSASVPSPPVRAALLQPLPAGVFADIYQLDNAAALGQGPPVQLFGHVDVESIERYSKPTVLAVLCGGSAAMATDQATPSCPAGTELTVPLHARYPHPQQRQQVQQADSWWQTALSVPVTTELAPPLVLVQCPSSASGSGEQEQWQAAELEAAQLQRSVLWERPAGNLRHGTLVAGGTAAALVLGVVAVLRALCRSIDQGRPEQRRQRNKQE